MKNTLISTLLAAVCLLAATNSLSGQFLRFYGTADYDGIKKVIPSGSEFYVIGYSNGQAQTGERKATVSRLNASGVVLWTKTLDKISMWSDGVVTPNGDLLLVGSTWPEQQSLMGLINSSGTFAFVRSYNVTGRESLTHIVLNPVPQNNAFPYYILGDYFLGSDRNAILMVADASGNIGWKKKYSSSTTNISFSRDLEALPNGDLLLTGVAVYRADNSGQIYNAFAIENPIEFSFIDVTQKTGGGFYAIGFNINFLGNNPVHLIKLDQDYIEGWQIEIPTLHMVTQVWSVGIDIYVTGHRIVGIKEYVVLLKFRDNGTSPAYQWTKYLELNETVHPGWAERGFTAFLPPNKIIYANHRTRTIGYGFDDGLISVSDMDLNTCMTQMVSDNIVVRKNLFNSPVLPSFVVVAVPTPVLVSSSSVTWSSSDACLTDCDCAFSSMQIHGPNPAQFQPVVCGGAPVTLGCQPGMGYTFTGIWGLSCPTIRSIMVNSCGTEAANEFMIIHSGSKGFNVNDLQIDFDNSSNITGPENNDINTGASPCGFQTGNAAMISGCPNVIVAGPGTIIPANAYVIIQTSSSAASGGLYDFSAFCTSGQQVYVIRSSCNRSADAFANTGIGSVTTGISVAGSCSSAVTYDKTSLTNVNGDYFIAPATYGNQGCTAPPANLVQVSTAIQFNWTLSGPGATQTGTYNGSGPYFSLNLLPTYFTQPGLYTLTLQGKCGDKICPCIVQFNVNCPDPCPCDLQTFQTNVAKGFATSFTSSSCNVCFSPLGLTGCQTVEWQVNPFTGPPIGTSVGNQTFCHTFSGPGTYNIKMVVTQKKADGTICETFAKAQTVTVTCGPMAPTGDPLIKNASFSENPVAGGLTTGGLAPGWSAGAGDPVLVGSVAGSQDGWGMAISGNASASDVLSSNETVCIAKTENGTLSLRIHVWGDPHENTGDDDRYRRKPPKKNKLTVQVSSGQGTGCPSGNCYTIGTLEDWPSFDTQEWYEVRIPYNLSNWVTSEACGKGAGTIPVRVLISVSNPFTDSQGDGRNRDAILIDNISFNSLSTGSEFPVFQEGTMRLYPNPTSGYFTLELAQAPAAGTILRVIKPSGQVVLEKQAQAGECIHTIDSGYMPAGMYFVQVLTDGRLVGVEKLVRQ